MAADFLTNLLDRALERTPVLQRRRPSRFEPVPDTASVGPALRGTAAGYGEKEPTAEIELCEVRDAPAFRSTTAMPRRAAVVRPPAPIAQDTGLDSIRSEEPIRPVASTGSEARQGSREETALSSLLVQATPKSVSAPPPPLVHTTPKPVTAVTPPMIETIVEEVEKPWPVIRSAHPSEGKISTPVVVAPPSPFPLRPIVVPISKRDHITETKAAPYGVSQKREMTAASVRPAQPAAPSVLLPLPRSPLPTMRSQPTIRQEAPPPTIQVTIGRIEVRATPPQAASPGRGTRPATPKLSLEDYLRSRSGGTR